MKTKDLTPELLTNKLPQEFCCPMCHGTDFALTDGFFINIVQDDSTNFAFGKTSIPCAALICKHCGFISQHAIGILNSDANKKVSHD